jgi:hypothetical protein
MPLPLNNHVPSLELDLVPITFNFVVDDAKLTKYTSSQLVDACMTLDGLQSHDFRAGAFQCFQTILINNSIVKNMLCNECSLLLFSLF